MRIEAIWASKPYLAFLSSEFPVYLPSFRLFFPGASFTLVIESHNEHRSLLTVHGRTWKQQVNPFSPRADTPIHQFVSVSLREKSS